MITDATKAAQRLGNSRTVSPAFQFQEIRKLRQLGGDTVLNRFNPNVYMGTRTEMRWLVAFQACTDTGTIQEVFFDARGKAEEGK